MRSGRRLDNPKMVTLSVEILAALRATLTICNYRRYFELVALNSTCVYGHRNGAVSWTLQSGHFQAEPGSGRPAKKFMQHKRYLNDRRNLE
jgi:hypothetical protein